MVDAPAQVFRVTTPNDRGYGSLRACAEAKGPRVCVFTFSGTIILGTEIVINHPWITIAGQTAPGSGIVLQGRGIHVRAGQVVIQHLKIRPGEMYSGLVRGVTLSKPNDDVHQVFCAALRSDCATTAGMKAYFASAWGADTWDSGHPSGGAMRNVVVSHLSISWTFDDAIAAYDSMSDVTIEGNLIGDTGRRHPTIPGKISGSKGILVGNGARNISVIGNVFAHVLQRTPLIGGRSEVVGNLIYNAESLSIFPPTSALPVPTPTPRPTPQPYFVELQKTLVKLGANAEVAEQGGYRGYLRVSGLNWNDPDPIYDDFKTSKIRVEDTLGAVAGRGFRTAPLLVYKDNWVASAEEMWNLGPGDRVSSGHLPTLAALPTERYEQLIRRAGSSSARRDATDLRLIKEVHCGTGGNLLTPRPAPLPAPAPTPVASPVNFESIADSDGDYLPDAWELRNGWEPLDRDDALRISPNGGSALNDYLEHLSGNVAEANGGAIPSCP